MLCLLRGHSRIGANSEGKVDCICTIDRTPSVLSNRRRMRERRRANGPPSLEAISVEASYSYCICWSFTSFALFHQRGKRVRFVVELECLDDGDDHLSTGGSRIRRVHTLKETSEDALDEHLRELRLRWRNRSSPTELLVSVRKSCR